MKKMLEQLQFIIFTILVALTIVSFLFAFGGEMMPIQWTATWFIAHVILLMLCVFVGDSRAYYRRIIPALICIASAMFSIFKPLLKHNKSMYSLFKKCYRLRKLAGGFGACYAHVQEVYDEFSGYDTGDE